MKAVMQFVEADRWVTTDVLVEAFIVSRSTIHATLHNDLGLSLRSARWVPCQLTEEHKKERTRCCRLIVKAKFYH